MKKEKVRKMMTFLLAAAMSLTAVGCTKQETEPKMLADYQYQNAPISGILTAKNGNIVDADGKEVVLFGINLGNWMLMETWMSIVSEYTHDWAHYDTLELLTERFGEEKTDELMRLYQENFLTEEDIAQIEKLGFNCVRVPFWYRNFMREDGSWLTENIEDNPGFQKLDWLLETCEKHGIYVILDLHGAPGGQSMNHSTGKAGRNLLYTEEENLQASEGLWRAIAERYKDNPTVAAYDLLNEPQNNGDYSGENAWPAESTEAVKQTNSVYARLYDAVRSVDQNHMISFEGIWSTSVLPNPKEFDYENMLYQLHLYDTDRGIIKYRVNELKKIRRKWDVAVLIGEFNNHAEEAFACDLYGKNDISYVKWTYKTFNTGGSWGVFNNNCGRINIKTASYEEIYAFMEKNLATENFKFDKEEMNRILPRDKQ